MNLYVIQMIYFFIIGNLSNIYDEVTTMMFKADVSYCCRMILYFHSEHGCTTGMHHAKFQFVWTIDIYVIFEQDSDGFPV